MFQYSIIPWQEINFSLKNPSNLCLISLYFRGYGKVECLFTQRIYNSPWLEKNSEWIWK